MFHQRYLNKNKGMTLIETIVSMWILGIVIVSMLSFVGATMSKRNQNRIQAIAVAKSELQDSEMSIRVEGNSDPIDHATILLFKSSYLADLENNEIKIEEENAFFTKYVIEATNKEVFVEDSKGVSSNNISNNASSNGSNNVSSNRVLDNNKE